jgi:hypothetical protein
VKIVEAADRLVLARGSAEHADTSLDRGGARIVELKSAEVAGEDFRELFHQLRLDRRREIVGVHQLRRCARDAFADLGVAVAECGYIDARGEIDVVVAVDVAQHAPAAALEGHWEEFHLAAEALEVLRAAIVIVL